MRIERNDNRKKVQTLVHAKSPAESLLVVLLDVVNVGVVDLLTEVILGFGGIGLAVGLAMKVQTRSIETSRNKQS